MGENINPHFSTYQVLSERASKETDLIASLKDKKCIYIESKKIFIRPNQLFWASQPLGRYAYTIPKNHELFKPFYDVVGVKSEPAGKDFVDILLDIVGEYFEQAKTLVDENRCVYDYCLKGIATAHDQGELTADELQHLREAPTVLNLFNQFTYPDEVLLKDSVWHAGLFGGELDQKLCKPVPELWSLFQAIDINCLSECACVELDYVDGAKKEESELAQGIQQRVSILGRLLHDKTSELHNKLNRALLNLTAESYEVVQIQASVTVGDECVTASPALLPAFYDMESNSLFLTRPVSEKSWTHILNALFHQLMPEEQGAEISKLTLSTRQFMNMPVEEAHRELTDAGIPELEIASEDFNSEGHMSSELDDIDLSQESVFPEEEFQPDAKPNLSQGISDSETAHQEPSDKVHSEKQNSTSPGSIQRRKSSADIGVEESTETQEATSPAQNKKHLPSGNKPAAGKKPRAKHKEQWDRRLLSYVRQKLDST